MATLVNRYKSNYTVSIQRDGMWGNYIGEGLPRHEACLAYEKELDMKLESMIITIPQLFSLDSEILGCTCLPQECHGQKIIERLERAKIEHDITTRLQELSHLSQIKLLVSGGRKYKNKTQVWNVLGEIHRTIGISEIIEGGALGLDTHCAVYGYTKCIPVRTEEADWERYKRSAGSIRNQVMLDKYQPDALLAFSGNNGTSDMVRRAAKHGIPILYSI
ncbi:SLOG family protein [Yersinia ruckeri]|uniref:SLOG family protein n=1 Tax=Yersinia ruckeri TaxID=29486 RepID=UPI002238742C|nr:SLOG family protein [Yersinia ruckeri]MCW6598799.1 SLOG family protein [Yersinia ruckeri]